MALVAIAAAAFYACSNEDIEINYTTVITVTPSSVVAPFSGNQVTSELQSFERDVYKLRTRMLVYNSEGVLVGQSVAYLANYQVPMRSDFVLANGTYTLLAITDVVAADDNGNVGIEYWKMSSPEAINKLSLQYQEKNPETDGFTHQQAILGIGKKIVTIEKGGSEFNVSPEPAGCLIKFVYKNIHTFSDVTQLGNLTDWVPGSVSFDKDGSYTLSAARSQYKVSGEFRYVDMFAISNVSAASYLSYYFTFPASDGENNFRSFYRIEKNTAKAPIKCKLEKGGEYELVFDLSKASNIKDVEPYIEKKN